MYSLSLHCHLEITCQITGQIKPPVCCFRNNNKADSLLLNRDGSHCVKSLQGKWFVMYWQKASTVWCQVCKDDSCYLMQALCFTGWTVIHMLNRLNVKRLALSNAAFLTKVLPVILRISLGYTVWLKRASLYPLAAPCWGSLLFTYCKSIIWELQQRQSLIHKSGPWISSKIQILLPEKAKDVQKHYKSVTDNWGCIISIPGISIGDTEPVTWSICNWIC